MKLEQAEILAWSDSSLALHLKWWIKADNYFAERVAANFVETQSDIEWAKRLFGRNLEEVFRIL